MKKVKVFFAAAALTLITVGVFAGKSKFLTYTFYASDNSTFYKPLGVVSSFASDVVVNSSANPIDISTSTSPAGTALFAYDGIGHYYQVSTNGTW